MALYRETVQRSYSAVILIVSVMLSVNIFLSDCVERSISTVNYIKISRMFFFGIMVFFILTELYKLKVKYKYTIIAHELIIHKIIGHEEIEVEKIDITTIKQMKKCHGIDAMVPSVFKGRKYMASSFNGNKHYCVYNNDGEIRRFYFAPSDKLMSKLRRYNIG